MSGADDAARAAVSTARRDALLRPSAVAVIGASADPRRIGHRPIEFLLRAQGRFEIYPVNPRYESIDGLRCYARMSDVPTPVDVAMVAVPAKSVLEAVEDCITHRVPWVVGFSAGFGETDAAGKRREAQLRALLESARGETRLIGPNCIGVADIGSGFIGSFATAFDEGEAVAGDVAFASQSGAFGVMVFREAQNSGVPLSRFISTGNEVDFELGEAIELFAHEPGVRVILAYMEGLRKGTRFETAVRAARERGKAVVVLKVGKTEPAAAAASSHTGSMVGSDDVYEAAFAKYGALRASSMDHLLDLAQVLRTGRRAAGPRLGILTLSGGAGVLMADEAVSAGLRVPRFTGDTLRSMRQAIPEYGSPHNPVDFTAQLINEPRRLAQCIDVLCGSDQVDLIAVFLGNQARMEGELIKSIQDAARRTAKPVAVTWVGGTGRAGETLRRLGIPAFSDPGRCVRALAGLQQHGRMPQGRRPSSRLPSGRRSRAQLAGHDWRSALCEVDAAELVQRYGIPVTDYAVASSAEQAAALASKHDGPVVMKIVSPDVLHKSDIGGVEIGLEGERAVSDGFLRILHAVRSRAPSARIEGVAISPVEQGSLELIVGVKQDPVFGSVVMVGAGGIYAEQLHDSARSLAPITRTEARSMLRGLRVWPLLEGARGMPRLDVGGVCDLLVKAGRLAIVEGPYLKSLDMNPVLVRRERQGVVVVDAKIVANWARDVNTEEKTWT